MSAERLPGEDEAYSADAMLWTCRMRHRTNKELLEEQNEDINCV